MRNPFQYGSVVRGEAFCNRQQEQRDLRRAMENAEKLFVYSERRLGKTSLVRTVLDKLPKRSFIRVYVDLWPTDNEASFVEQMGKALAESLATTPSKMLEAAKTFLGSLSPRMTLDDQGRPKVSIDLTEPTRPGQHLEKVLSVPAKVAARQGKRVVVVFDECQRVMEYGDDLVERKLRSTIQHHEDVSYIFLGSRKHLIQAMFLDKSRPLYRAAGHYPLESIAIGDGGRCESRRWRAGLRNGHHVLRGHLCRTPVDVSPGLNRED